MFALRMAELNMKIHCQYSATKVFCEAYLIPEDGTVDAEIAITGADLDCEREIHGRSRPAEAAAASCAYLEQLALLRKTATLLPQRNRLLFHGSALTIDGQGILFTAKSGTGKSTHARLWRQVFGERVTMINDDKPFLMLGQDRVTVYGNPWLGKHHLGGNGQAPLRALCQICRAEENRVERVSPREAMPLLLQQTFAPEGAEAAGATLALVQKLSRQVPVYRIYCNMDPQAALTAWEGIQSDGRSN